MADNSGNEGRQEKQIIEEKQKPLVSVVIPAYNCSRTLARAIDSALAQEVSMEILVLDNGSREDLTGVMARYQGNPVVHYRRNEKNLGASGSRNMGVKLARGRYVAFLDSDDWWEKDKLKKQLARLEETGCVLCATARELVTPEGEQTGRIIPVSEEITYRQMLTGNSINCSSVLLKTEVAREFPMCHEDSHEDYIMWLRILQKYGKACAVNEPLLKYRLSSSGKSGNKLKSAGMTFKVYRYMGFGMVKSCWCFLRYAYHGTVKYAAAHLRAGRHRR